MVSELDPLCWFMAAAFAGVILLALGVKLVEVYRARNWPATMGEVTRSQVRARKGRTTDTGHQYESEPLVNYQYSVNGKPYRGSRISFAERIGGADVLPTIQHYPVGKSVPVYYNPLKPSEAVLERTLPPVVFVGVGILLLFFVGVTLLGPLALFRVVDWIAPLLRHPDRAPLVAMLGAMGIFAAMMWYAVQRQVWATEAWSKTAGRVLVSDVESELEPGTYGEKPTRLYHPSIVYTFEVDGQQYISDHVNIGSQVRGTVGGRAPWFVNERVAKYTKDDEVTVFYNPSNPTESTLERSGGGTWFLLTITLVLWAVAGAAAWL